MKNDYVPLGLFRLFLAISVVATHFWVAAVPDAGRHAVISFFCISGFLITKMAREAYHNRPAAFLANRFLRLYPAYFFAIAFGAMTLALLPAYAFDLNGSFEWPPTPGTWLSQFFILGLNDSIIRLSPSTWSLAIELYFYIIIGLVTYRSLRLTLLAFAVSCVIGFLAIARLIDIPFYMSSYGSACVFFAGSLAYFMSDRTNGVAPHMMHGACGCAFILYVMNAFGTPLLLHAPMLQDISLVLSAGLTIIILLSCKNIWAGNQAIRNISAFCGKISYPVFLLHWAAGVYVSVWLSKNSAAFLVAALVPTLLLSTLIVMLIDGKLEGWRKKIRNNASTNPLAI